MGAWLCGGVQSHCHCSYCCCCWDEADLQLRRGCLPWQRQQTVARGHDVALEQRLLSCVVTAYGPAIVQRVGLEGTKGMASTDGAQSGRQRRAYSPIAVPGRGERLFRSRRASRNVGHDGVVCGRASGVFGGYHLVSCALCTFAGILANCSQLHY